MRTLAFLACCVSLPAAAQEANICEVARPLTGQRLLRRMSLDLRNTVPGIAEQDAQSGKALVPDTQVDAMIASPQFAQVMRVAQSWCEMHQDDGTWSRPRLILATETDLTAREVVEIYAQRWGIEPLFHNLKRWWGVTNLWQQSMPALELWMQIRCTAYALMQLLALKLSARFLLMEISPWRKGP